MAETQHPTLTLPRTAVELRLPRTFTALRHRNYRLFWSGQMISLIGTWMQSLAQSWLVYRLTNSPLMLGLVGFATALPILLFSLVGGVVADRVNKRSLIVATQTAAMLQAFLLAFLVGTDLVQVWHVVLLAFTLGVINAFDTPARQSFVIEMVGREDLMNAIALNSSVFNGARVVGPAVAGLLVGWVGEASAFFLNGASFLAVIAGLLMMRLPPSPRAARAESPWENLVAGLTYLRRHRVLLGLMGLVGMASIFGMPYTTLMPVFARDILQVGAAGQGFLMTATGLGALIGALTLASLGDFKRKGQLVTAGNFLFPAMLFFFALSTWFPSSALFLLGVGWAMVTQNATTNTLIQTSVPDQMRGRVMSVYTLAFMGMMPLGSLQAGAVANAFGAPFAVEFGAIIAAAFALFVFCRVPEIRQLE